MIREMYFRRKNFYQISGKSFFLKLLDTFFNLSISKLSTLGFKLAKSLILAKSDVSRPVAFFKSSFVT